MTFFNPHESAQAVPWLGHKRLFSYRFQYIFTSHTVVEVTKSVSRRKYAYVLATREKINLTFVNLHLLKLLKRPNCQNNGSHFVCVLGE